MMTIKKKPGIIILSLFFLFSIFTYAQDNNPIKGRITDKSGNPVGNVVVSVLDEFTQVSSDISGDFSISAVPGKVLLFSKVGFQQLRYEIKDKTEINIQLEKQTREEVYQVAYGTRTKSTLTSAISTISADDLSKSPVTTLGNAIQGLGSGLTVLHSVGAEPGWDQPDIYIRGVQSFGSGVAPLVLVDNGLYCRRTYSSCRIGSLEFSMGSRRRPTADCCGRFRGHLWMPPLD